jgi:hypothetical protein
MDKLLIELNEVLRQIKLLLHKFYNKLCFILNKQLIIRKMYEPLIERKNRDIEDLSNNILVISNETNSIIKDSERLAMENNLLKDKILIIQELLLKK